MRTQVNCKLRTSHFGNSKSSEIQSLQDMFVLTLLAVSATTALELKYMAPLTVGAFITINIFHVEGRKSYFRQFLAARQKSIVSKCHAVAWFCFHIF